MEFNDDTDSLNGNQHSTLSTGCPNYIMKSLGKYTRRDPAKRINTSLKFSEKLSVTYEETSEELEGWHPQFPLDLLKIRATNFNKKTIFNSKVSGLIRLPQMVQFK